MTRLLEAAGRRRQLEQQLSVGTMEYAVLRALASALGKPPPPLEIVVDEEEDVRRDYIMRIVEANIGAD